MTGMFRCEGGTALMLLWFCLQFHVSFRINLPSLQQRYGLRRPYRFRFRMNYELVFTFSFSLWTVGVPFVIVVVVYSEVTTKCNTTNKLEYFFHCRKTLHTTLYTFTTFRKLQLSSWSENTVSYVDVIDKLWPNKLNIHSREISKYEIIYIQGGSNMTGTICV